MSQINSKLADKYDGKDGKPKFDSKEIAEYALKNGMQNISPEQVYKAKHEADLIDWHRKDALKGNKAPTVGEGRKGGGKPTPPSKPIEKMSEDERTDYLVNKVKSKMDS